MSDIFSREERSRIMSRIGGKDTGPELKVRKILHALGYRYRLHDKKLPGKPDIVLPRWKAAIFVHGCFWHGHMGCKRATIPQTNTAFWERKIAGNKDRDRRVVEELNLLGYKSLVIWSCEISDVDGLLSKINDFLPRKDK